MGTPSEGGFGAGFERIILLILNAISEDEQWTINDVVAFPLNEQKKDLMLDSPRKIAKD
jgi:aspartyl-tRNA synthetase